VNWHEIMEQRSYDLHQVVASVLVKDPTKLERVVEWIKARLADPDNAIQSKDALQEWLGLIGEHGLASVLEGLSDAGEEARRLRYSSPFAVIMPRRSAPKFSSAMKHAELEHILRASKALTGGD
jgi:hypothetical protein